MRRTFRSETFLRFAMFVLVAVLVWSGKSFLVGCKFGEGEGEVVESVCQLKHLGERHVVVTERHVVS